MHVPLILVNCLIILATFGERHIILNFLHITFSILKLYHFSYEQLEPVDIFSKNNSDP